MSTCVGERPDLLWSASSTAFCHPGHLTLSSSELASGPVRWDKSIVFVDCCERRRRPCRLSAWSPLEHSRCDVLCGWSIPFDTNERRQTWSSDLGHHCPCFLTLLCVLCLCCWRWGLAGRAPGCTFSPGGELDHLGFRACAGSPKPQPTSLRHQQLSWDCKSWAEGSCSSVFSACGFLKSQALD